MLYLCTNIPKMYSKKKYPVYFCCCVECLRRIQFLICMQMRVVIHIISAFYLSFWLSAVCFFFFICCTGMRTKWDLFSAIFAEFFSIHSAHLQMENYRGSSWCSFFFCRGSIEKKDDPNHGAVNMKRKQFKYGICLCLKSHPTISKQTLNQFDEV